MPPEEALFRRRGAPERFAEDDIYWADRHLRDDQVLPDSDLLKAVHAYASEFYGRRGGATDFESFDETALIAIGVLLEEWAGDVLGAEGEGAFVEAGWEDGRDGLGEDMGEESGWNRRIISKRGKRRKKRRKDKEVELEEGQEEEEEEAEAVIEQESNDTYKKSKNHKTKSDTETESSDDQSRSDDEDVDTDPTRTDDIDESNENTESSDDKASESDIDEGYSTEEPTNANTNRTFQPISLLSSSHPPSPSSYSSSSSSLPSSSSASSSASSKPSRNHKSKRRKIVHSGAPA